MCLEFILGLGGKQGKLCIFFSFTNNLNIPQKGNQLVKYIDMLSDPAEQKENGETKVFDVPSCESDRQKINYPCAFSGKNSILYCPLLGKMQPPCSPPRCPC